ncbi:MAG: cadherin-like beta sandwich domain-containing protein [Lachnospiraceae bacterium]|nr:cadherin-like beta sandwich domain-containing protein [Lachnospiraceae bacterium]
MKTKMTSAGFRASSDRRRASVAVLKLAGAKAGAIIAIAVICLMISGLFAGTPVFASSCKIYFSSSANEVMVGDTVAISLTIEGDVIPGIFEGYISYNSDVLEYVSGPDCIAGGEGTLRISDMGYGSDTLARKYEMQFKASKMGTCDFSMRGTPEVYEADLGYLMSVSVGKLSIEVKAASKASSDATLGLMRINPGELSPAFSASVFEYTVFVPYEVTEIYVSASPNDPTATVKIEGNTGLNVGQNRILVLVTAENGDVKKYVIYAARGQEAEEAGQNTAADDHDTNGQGQENSSGTAQQNGTSQGWAFYAEEADGSLYLTADSKYKVSRNAGDVEIPDGYNKTSVMISGHTVTAYAPANEPGSDYLLLILEKEDGKPELYSFDRVEKTLQRLDRSRIVLGNKTGSGYSTIDEEELVRSYEKSLGTMTMVIAILSGVCMLLLIIVIRMAIKNRNELD